MRSAVIRPAAKREAKATFVRECKLLRRRVAHRAAASSGIDCGPVSRVPFSVFESPWRSSPTSEVHGHVGSRPCMQPLLHRAFAGALCRRTTVVVGTALALRRYPIIPTIQ